MKINFQEIKNKFGIIGNDPLLERAIEIAVQAAPTDLNVLISGESGTGKEFFPQIIHQYSARKHGPYFAVNCGAIPEGTIDSELFGHEKGSFTGAIDTRKGYFEVANGGTLFLDEVGELPLSTQARLLRVLETGEFIRVGSSKVMKTDVRVVAATNIDFLQAIQKGKFRQDLYYRLNTLPIYLPPLRERKEDILLLFRKFVSDCSARYKTPPVRLLPDAEQLFLNYYWPGNIRELKNVAEQMCILEKEREIDASRASRYLPNFHSGNLPTLAKPEVAQNFADLNEKEMMLKMIADNRKEINELKLIIQQLLVRTQSINLAPDFQKQEPQTVIFKKEEPVTIIRPSENDTKVIELEESLSLIEKEKDMIKKALLKHKGKRKKAAEELGISERTLYRKINEFNLHHL
ncbi:MAG: sigma-54 dependent transcriptional regulator [Bacteroidia bacterium]|nr:sigma-54 dependent transcriptional regulator [Bacteroidia bacterium]